MTPSTRSAPHGTAGPRWRRAAALILGLAGLETIVYSPFLPVPTDLAAVVVVGTLAFGYVASALRIAGLAVPVAAPAFVLFVLARRWKPAG
jgi:hypothetical protein